jgi:hypothetical protein
LHQDHDDVRFGVCDLGEVRTEIGRAQRGEGAADDLPSDPGENVLEAGLERVPERVIGRDEVPLLAEALWQVRNVFQ